MCTENLGNETGCEMTETTMHPYTDNESAPLEIVVTKKFVSRSFPPPLTTMSGAESILVSPYREDGRLVIKATRSPSSMFRTERSRGRLRMSVLGPCDEEEAVVDELLEVDEGEMSLKGVEDMMMVKVGGSGGRCKQGEPQDSRVFKWDPFNWVATT